MALSRAAAAAARKAAKSRGLQGNRADDGSMLSSPATQKSMKEFYTSSDIDKKSYSKMNDAELGDKWKEASAEVKELEGLAENLPLFDEELTVARKKLRSIEEELDSRGVINYELGLYQSDVDEAMGLYT